MVYIFFRVACTRRVASGKERIGHYQLASIYSHMYCVYNLLSCSTRLVINWLHRVVLIYIVGLMRTDGHELGIRAANQLETCCTLLPRGGCTDVCVKGAPFLFFFFFSFFLFLFFFFFFSFFFFSFLLPFVSITLLSRSHTRQHDTLYCLSQRPHQGLLQHLTFPSFPRSSAP